MSHIANIKIEVKDLDAVRAVCAENGWAFHEGQRTYKWFGTHFPDSSFTKHALASPPPGLTATDFGQCDHAISIPGCAAVSSFGVDFEIGLRRTPTGYRIVADDLLFHMKGVGKNCGTFLQFYGVHKATIEAKRRGYTVTRTAAKNGQIQLAVTGM